MENALYYTFSTIAQALGGAVALLAAFSLFKLQSIDTEIRMHAEHVVETFAPDDGKHTALRNHCLGGRWAQFLVGLPPGSVYQARIERMQALAGARERLTASLKVAVPLTLITMAAAVVVLAFVPALKDCVWASRLMLAIGAIAFAASVYSYRTVISSLFD